MTTSVPSVSIVVPTYNERDNIEPLAARVKAALEPAWEYELIVVDDSSPDGTADVVRRLAEQDQRVRLHLRPRRGGLGTAVVAGFRIAVGSRWVVMDADLSHQPEELLRLIGALDDADVVIGSRYVQGGAIPAWPLWRKVASRSASLVGQRLLRLPVKDTTSGFAAFRQEVVKPMLGELQIRGFKVVLEVLARSRDLRVREVPITFVDRVAGRSKLGPGEVVAFFRQCWDLRRLS